MRKIQSNANVKDAVIDYLKAHNMKVPSKRRDIHCKFREKHMYYIVSDVHIGEGDKTLYEVRLFLDKDLAQVRKYVKEDKTCFETKMSQPTTQREKENFERGKKKLRNSQKQYPHDMLDRK